MAVLQLSCPHAQMFDFLYHTVLTALPLLIPVFVLMAERLRPVRERSRRLWLRAAFVAYALSLVLLIVNAWAAGDGGLFFLAFYGSLETVPPIVYAAYCLQLAASLALLIVINWKTIQIFFFARKTESGKSPDAGSGERAQ